MKKFFCIILICLLLSSCSLKKVTIETGQTVKTIANFYIIKTLYHGTIGNYPVRLCYDPETKIMYYVIGTPSSYSFSISPYYLSNGEIGIYGKNYKDGEIK